jgi:mRNA-degrading endonuclease RelE of RelBE toxin-antitoxin system
VTDYTLAFVPEASRDLRLLDRPVAQRILNKLRWLSQNFDHLTPEARAQLSELPVESVVT